jgi:hypothetical protein
MRPARGWINLDLVWVAALLPCGWSSEIRFTTDALTTLASQTKHKTSALSGPLCGGTNN